MRRERHDVILREICGKVTSIHFLIAFYFIYVKGLWRNALHVLATLSSFLSLSLSFYVKGCRVSHVDKYVQYTSSASCAHTDSDKLVRDVSFFEAATAAKRQVACKWMLFSEAFTGK